MTHFYDSTPADIAMLTNAQAIDAFLDRADAPVLGTDGLTLQQMKAHPVSDTWSIQEIVLHLLDTDLIACYRMKRIIAEDRPRIDVYDENAFAARLAYDQQDAKVAALAFLHNRINMAALLRTLPDAAFDRVADHPETGDLSLGKLLRAYVHHVDHHMAFLRRKRAMVEGK